MISKTEAVEQAKQWLSESGKPIADRQAKAVLTETYVVKFPPPPDTLAGDFTVIIDAETGQVIGAFFER